MSIKVYIPLDSGSVALGADDVAAAIAKKAETNGDDVKIVRNGSFGMYWLEPMVEVETPDGRLAYGPVAVEDVDDLFASDFLSGGGTQAFPWQDTEYFLP
ncbi:hypothetical protein ACQ0MK_02360 [Thalassospira lucentensis]|uniref:hypothetical protein n=1 Tax=Thalassospira lucentensis TaxID=168935 RepID=UPI003D2F25B9